MTFIARCFKILQMKIGNLEFKNNIFLAPMAGVTDVGYRALAKFFGAEICYTEMVSAKGLIYGQNKALTLPLNQKFIEENPKFAKNKSAWLLLAEEIETPKAVQIFGADPKFMANACKLDLLDEFDIIDINMGCPAPKIIRNGEGSSLMLTPEVAEAIIKECVKVSNRPVTVKFRKGFKTENAEEFAKMCERAGASAITIHGRLMTQGYSGIVDYETIKKVKSAVKIPVIGSGDVKDEPTLRKMLETGVDGVMIGRASYGNPVIFKTLTEILEGKEPEKMSKFILRNDFFKDVLTNQDLEIIDQNEEYVKYICAKKHIQILRKYYAEEFLVKYMRKHMLWYASGVKGRPEVKQKIAMSNNLEKSLDYLKELVYNFKKS